MLKQCYSPTKRSLKSTPVRPERSVLPRARFLLTLILWTLTLSSNLEASPAPVDNPPKTRTTVGYSIDFGRPAIKPPTTPVAVQELKRGADNGDALAQNNLAYLYTFGLEVPQDYR